MKKSIIIILAIVLVLLTACGGSSGGSSTGGKSGTDDGNPEEISIWTKSEIPVRLDYDKMWEYGDSALTEDGELINAVIKAIKALKIGSKTDEVTDDFTDVLRFTFEDESVFTIEFENQCWVKSENERYKVEGLDRVRELLEKMFEAIDPSELDQPNKFQLRLFQDDKEGQYWMLFDTGCGTKFESLTNGELTNQTLYKWGVKDDTFYINYLDGKNIEYALSYGDGEIHIGDITLKEVKGGYYSELSGRWGPIDRATDKAVFG